MRASAVVADACYLSPVANVQDVVERFRELVPGVTGKKLQKLLYYAQAWSLAWDGQPLFPDDFEAWVEGPVVRSVYADERYGTNSYQPGPAGNAATLSAAQNATIESVAAMYGARSGEWLSRLTHREAPWRTARAGLAATEASQNRISKVEMSAFYSSSEWGEEKRFSPAFLRGLELLVSMPEDEVVAIGQPVAVSIDDHLRWLESGEEP